MSKLANILSYVLYGILFITILFTVMFFTGGDVPGEAYETPVYTDLFINWGYILLFATIGITVIVELVKIVLNPKNAVRSLISFGVLVVIALVSYSLADGTPLKLSGEPSPDNVYSTLKLAGAFIYTTYALLGIIIVVILATEIGKLFK